jgi:Protein of unknown function (DUF2892)
MTMNMGSLDRGFRLVVAILLAVLFFTGKIEGTTGIVMMVLAVVFAGTSFIGVCPLYLPFGISTLKKKSQ